MKITALSIAILIFAPSLLANTVTLTTTQNLGPGPALTYVEVVSPGTVPPFFAAVSESGIFNSFGTFGVALPVLNLPSGSTVTSATLQVAFTPNVADSGLFVVSNVPVDPTQPFSGTATAGSHFEFLLDTTNTAVGSSNVTFGEAELGRAGAASVISFDYTAPTESAVQTASPLAPITIDLIFNFGFQTQQSASAANNTITTFNENFSFLSSPVVSTLDVDYTPAPVPEPSSRTLALAGAFAFIWVLVERRTPNAA